MAAEQMADRGEAPGQTAPPAAPPASPPAPASPPTSAGPESAALPPARPLDSIDRDILRILQTDGRASIRSVAERVHVSRANAYA
nr:AsnC family protein [Streptomyces sp. DSM 41633]